jgi:prophage antirepressor-like protein
METAIAIKDFNGFQIKVYGTVAEPVFLARDVAAWIGHSTPHKLLEAIDESEKGVVIADTLGGIQELACVTDRKICEVSWCKICSNSALTFHVKIMQRILS